MRKFLSLILSAIILSGFTASSFAVEQPEVPNAVSAIVVEQESGRVLYSYNADEERAPASITKVMTALLIVEAIERGEMSLDDIVTTSEYANSQGGSQIWLSVGEQMSVYDLLKAVCVVSANDAAVALAEYHSGSEEAFAAEMNKRAKELGMNNTNFVSACGLDRDGHYTTAYDITKMADEILKHDIIREFSLIWMDYLRDGATQLVNTNKLINDYDGITGLKTGTTDLAGYCFVATAEKNGLGITTVVLGTDSNEIRFEESEELLDWAFDNYKISELPPLGEPLRPITVTEGTELNVKIGANAPKEIVLPKDSAEVRQELTLLETITAPVEEGTAVGRVQVFIGDELLTEYDVVTLETVDEMSFGVAMLKVLQRMVRMK